MPHPHFRGPHLCPRPSDRPRKNIVAFAILTLLTAISLAGCATQQSGQKPSKFVLSNDWVAISVSESDLTLPEELHLPANSLHRRSGKASEIEDLYLFEGGAGVEGYILTSRVSDSSFPDEIMLEMRQARLFHSYARQQPETAQYEWQFETISFFPRTHPHSVGHYATVPSKNGQVQCFFARLGTLLDRESINSLPPGAIDTVVKAALCGKRIDEAELVAALQHIDIAPR